MPKGWSRSSYVYVSSEACSSSEQLDIVLQHEYVHVQLNYMGIHPSGNFFEDLFDSRNLNSYQEYMAYSVEKKQYEAWGYHSKDIDAKVNYYRSDINFVPNISDDYFSNMIRKTEPQW